jgi:hypothetical protein
MFIPESLQHKLPETQARDDREHSTMLARWHFYRCLGQPWGAWQSLTDRQHNQLRAALSIAAGSLRIQGRF